MQRALDHDGRVHGADQVRTDLLTLQILYHDWGSAGSGIPGQLNAQMGESLSFRDTLVEVAKETDRITEVAQTEVTGKIQALIFLVELGAIFEG